MENINELCVIQDALMQEHAVVGPFALANVMYNRIDSIQHGDALWKSLKASVPHDSNEDAPRWKKKEYKIWY
jgi:hypothetical protein